MAVIAYKCNFIKLNVVDIDPNKIASWNEKNLDLLPVYEPGLKEIIGEVRIKIYFLQQILIHLSRKLI